jgi:hypothetical protein
MMKQWERAGKFYQTDKDLVTLAAKEREFHEKALPASLTETRLGTLPR